LLLSSEMQDAKSARDGGLLLAAGAANEDVTFDPATIETG
jgi:hypothetical protein